MNQIPSRFTVIIPTGKDVSEVQYNWQNAMPENVLRSDYTVTVGYTPFDVEICTPINSDFKRIILVYINKELITAFDKETLDFDKFQEYINHYRQLLTDSNGHGGLELQFFAAMYMGYQYLTGVIK